MGEGYYRYNYNVGLTNHFALEGIPDGTREGFKVGAELNILSRFLWGLGAALNSVYNALGACVKFQVDLKTNRKRARLLTKIWRYCKKNNIEINSKNFPRRKIKEEKIDRENFEWFKEYIKRNVKGILEPIQIEVEEWWYKGCFIQRQDRDCDLSKYVVFKDTEDQEHVDVCYTFKEAIKLCEDNEVKQFKQGWEIFIKIKG